jgi:hypothetical protein
MIILLFRHGYQDTIITHFASMGGNSRNYSYAIYSLLIKLREAFNINQKVELLEEKLRKFFYYWLDLCSRKMSENVIYDGKIIIVLEGIENFMDPETKSESSLKFWLPKNLPEKIRFIVTASPSSKSSDSLRNMGCSVITILSEPSIVKSWLDSSKSRPKRDVLVDDDVVRRLNAILDAKMADYKVRMLYAKSMIGLLAPSVYPGMENEAHDRQIFGSALSKMDWKTLESRFPY